MSSIPHSLLLFRKNKQSRVKCDSCGEIHRTRHTILFKGKILCSNCKLRLPSSRLIMSTILLINPISGRAIPLEKALERTYEVKATTYGKQGLFNIHFSPSLTKSLIGHKVKLVLVK